MMAVVTSQLISKMFKLQKEIFERGLTVSLTADTWTSGERSFFLKVIILTERSPGEEGRSQPIRKEKEKAWFWPERRSGIK